ncbi:MAG: hypothetical protein Ct9H300mP9_0530 [Candidatus Neomarinimicrobiota bacterium]|nr:MAG: hypothetical protein Ct9H300mP9_0530 [Candidatus Neomarinimicrobiota bacterium]
MNICGSPFTANRDFKSSPRLMNESEGMYYKKPDGTPVLDGTAGLWCCNAGHANRKIVKSIQEQASKLDYAPSFQMGQILGSKPQKNYWRLPHPVIFNMFFLPILVQKQLILPEDRSRISTTHRQFRKNNFSRTKQSLSWCWIWWYFCRRIIIQQRSFPPS